MNHKTALTFILLLTSILLYCVSQRIRPMFGRAMRQPNNSDDYDFIYSWELIKTHHYQHQSWLDLTKISCYSLIQNGLYFKFIYAVYDKSNKLLELYLASIYSSITSGHDISYDLGAPQPLTRTKVLSIHSIKYHLINSDISQWLASSGEKLRVILAIDCYEDAVIDKDKVYVIHALLQGRESPMRIVLEEEGLIGLHIIKGF